MKNDEKNIDKLFKEALKHYKESPPIYTWYYLKENLKKEKLRKKANNIRWIAACIAIIAAFSAGYLLQYHKSTQKIIIANNDTLKQQNKINNTYNYKQLKETTSNSQKVTAENFINNKKQQNIKQEPKSIYKSNNSISFSNSNTNNISSEKTNQIKINRQNINRLQTLLAKNIKSDFIQQKNKIKKKKELLKNQNSKNISFLETINTNDITEYNIKREKLRKHLLKSGNNQKNRWTLQGQFSPNYSYRNLKQLDNNSTKGKTANTSSKNYFDDNEKGLIAYSGGLNINYQVKNKWSLQSGIYYSKIGQYNNNVIVYKDPNDPKGSFIQTSAGNIKYNTAYSNGGLRPVDVDYDSDTTYNIQNSKLTQKFEFIEIPLIVKYKVIDTKIDFHILCGLSTGILINNKTYLKKENEKDIIYATPNINSLIYNGWLGIGIEYPILKKITLNIDPNFKYSLKPFNNSDTFKYFPYSISLFTGISYNL